jgi:membrane-bound lytic murein transglycosylase D
MKKPIPNPKIICCASIFALSLAACSSGPKPKDANLTDNSANQSSGHLVKLKKGHRTDRLHGKFPDPRSYDNLWDRLFDRYDLPEVSHPEVDRELSWFMSHPTYIERVQSRAEPFLYSIVKQLEKQNMPAELALLPVIESAFQPHAVSPAHAAGIWQFIPATGRHYGLKSSYSYDGRRDIYASTRAAIKYLKKLHNDFNGDWLLAIAGYNCGEGAVGRAIQRNQAQGLPTDFWSLNLPQETRTYVPRLLAVAKLFNESEAYGISLRPIPNKPLYKTVVMKDQVDLAVAANAADISLDKLFELARYDAGYVEIFLFSSWPLYF